MRSTIYEIRFASGDTYIGSTVNFKVRRNTHLRHAKKGKSVNRKLQQAFDANPVPEIVQIASGFSRNTAHELEAAIIRDRRPTLNVVTSPTPLPPTTTGVAKPFGDFVSVRDASEALGVSYSYLKRLARSMSCDQVLAKLAATKQPRIKKPTKRDILPPNPHKDAGLLLHNGTWYRIAEIRKVGKRAVRTRIKNGSSYFDALTTPPDPVVHVSKICKRYGVNYGVYYARRVAGWNVLQALGIRPKPHTEHGGPKVKKRMITVDGKTMTLDAWAKHLGIKSNVIHSRLGLGWSEAEALGLSLRPRAKRALERAIEQEEKDAKRAEKTYTIAGITGTLGEICRTAGFPYHIASSRRAAGWPQERWFLPTGYRGVWHGDPYELLKPPSVALNALTC